MWISSFVGMNALPQLCILGPDSLLSCLSLPISPSVPMPVLCNFDYHSFVIYLEMMNTVFPGLFFFQEILISKFLLWFCILGLFFCLVTNASRILEAAFNLGAALVHVCLLAVLTLPVH